MTPLAAFLIAIVVLCIGILFTLAGPDNLRKAAEPAVRTAARAGKHAQNGAKWCGKPLGWLLALPIAFPFLTVHWGRKLASRASRPSLPRRPGRHTAKTEVPA